MNFGPGEMIFIAVFALLIFGPKKLPEVGRQVGRAFREFRRATSELTDELKAGLEEPPGRQTRTHEEEPPPSSGG